MARVPIITVFRSAPKIAWPLTRKFDPADPLYLFDAIFGRCWKPRRCAMIGRQRFTGHFGAGQFLDVVNREDQVFCASREAADCENPFCGVKFTFHSPEAVCPLGCNAGQRKLGSKTFWAEKDLTDLFVEFECAAEQFSLR